MRLDVIHTNADKLLATRVDEPPNAVNLFNVDVARCSIVVICSADACGKECRHGNQQAES
jgi:hypothetical protein